MSQASVLEQYMLELINAERARVGAQPLVLDSNLNEAAENHSRWMIATDTFSHTGSGGSSAGARMAAAGYSFTGSWTWGENIAWSSTGGVAGYVDEVQRLHANLMNSPGHRTNLLSNEFREVGIGFETGAYGSYDSAFVTQNFARSGSSVFLTGVAYNDQDGDRFYDPGEGFGGVSVTAKGTGGTYAASTAIAGGYDLVLPPGTYTVTFSGTGIATSTYQVTIGAANRKLDLIVSSAAGTITGTAGADTLVGTAGADTIAGGAGNDLYTVNNSGDQIIEVTGAGYDKVRASVSFGLAGQYIEQLSLTGTANLNGWGNFLANTLDGNSAANRLAGGSGADTVNGGAGNDVLTGGAGKDMLRGGSGGDIFDFDLLTETPFGASRDVIADWDSTDRIDFASIDARAAIDGNQSFAFAGAGTMASEGQVKVYQSGGNTYVVGNATPDATADFEIEILGLHALTGADFIL